ncbi:MAG: ankyrin repeat domain-containing protein [Burkholderiaceae bacterium]
MNPKASRMQPPAYRAGMTRATRALILAARLAVPGILLPGTAAAQVAPTPVQVRDWSPWFGAAHRGDIGALQAALDKGADIDQRDAYGRTALHVATFARRHEVIGYLLRRKADPALLEADRYDAVTIAAVADDEPGLRTLLAGGASAGLTTSRYDGTALIAAAHLGHDGVVRQLIAAGAPLDHVNNLHWTAAIEAIVLGDGGPRHQASLRALIDAGANLALTDSAGNTPLDLARQRGYQPMVEMIARATGEIRQNFSK